MDRDGPATETHVSRALERELGLIREAILLVASGGGSRVLVSGLHFGEALLGPARVLADSHGLTIRPLWSVGESGLDLAIEPADADASVEPGPAIEDRSAATMPAGRGAT